MSKLINLSATGNFGAPGFRLGSCTVTAGSANGTVTLRDGGAGGTIVLQLAATIGFSSPHTLSDSHLFDGQPHATIVGAGCSANVEML